MERDYQEFKEKDDLELIREHLKNNLYIILPNQFPYDLEPHVSHLIFWCRPNVTIMDAFKIARDHFDEDKFVITKNLEINKSKFRIIIYSRDPQHPNFSFQCTKKWVKSIGTK